MKNNVTKVCDNSICIGCGACVGVCSLKCISLSHNPAGFLRAYVNESACINCNKCINVCPQIASCVFEETREISGFIGYATDINTRNKGQSGGVVTALLQYLFDNNEIEGAVVNRFNKSKHINEAVYVDNNISLEECSGSYYSQSDVNRVVCENSDKKMAVVLLGCQSRSIRLAEDKGYLNNVKYKLGLVCESQYSFMMLKDLAQEAGIIFNEIDAFRWKDKAYGSWPGNVRIENQGQEVMLKSRLRTRLKCVYQNFACTLCQDKMNLAADIVCGDPWGIDVKDVKKGYTCIIARTQNGLELLRNAEENGYIELMQLDSEKFYLAQHINKEYYENIYKKLIFCKKKKWAYPGYYSSNSNEELGFPSKKTVRQLQYLKFFYDCTDSNKLRYVIAIRKCIIKIGEIFRLPLMFIHKIKKLRYGYKE